MRTFPHPVSDFGISLVYQLCTQPLAIAAPYVYGLTVILSGTSPSETRIDLRYPEVVKRSSIGNVRRDANSCEN